MFHFYLGVDPEGRKVSYSISGPYFSVDRESGIVKLIKEVDREQISEIETIITITGKLTNECNITMYDMIIFSYRRS